jgi:hypothetical protein
LPKAIKFTEPIEPTEDDLRLLTYFGLTEFDDIAVAWGDSGGYEIDITEDGGFLKTVQIPFGEAEPELSPMGEYYCGYPRIFSDSKSGCSLEERNLRGVLRDLAAHFKAIEDAKLLALKAAKEAEEEAALRIRMEYCELHIFDLGDHPKAATCDQFKTGHSEGLRHTH